MKVTFLPSNEANTAKIPGQDVAMIIAEPDSIVNATEDTKFPVMFFLHGKDNLGGGTLSSLQTYWEGQFSGIPEDWKKAVDKYGIIGVALHYGGSLFSYNQWKWAYDFIMKRYNCYVQVFDAGFSWGAGSEQKCFTTQTAYCERQALTMLIAPTIENNSNWSLPGSFPFPVWVVVNKGDNVTGTGAAKNIVNNINNNTPIIPATYTELNQNGHGGRNESLGLAPMPGFAENAYELFLDILKNGPRAPRLGTAPPPTVPTTPTIPTTPTEPTTPITREVIIDYTGTGPKFHVSGKNTKDWNKASKWQWVVSAVPKGVNPYTVKFPGGGYIESDVEVPVKGQYVFKLIVTWPDQTTDDADITVNYGEIVEPPAPVITDITIKEGDIRLIFPNGKKYVTTSLKLEDIVNNYNLEEGKTTNYDEQD